jgi:membrane protease YdiL (CAAX protease family)
MAGPVPLALEPRHLLTVGARFAPWTTAIYALLWLLVVIGGWAPLIEHDAAAWLADPARAAARTTSRDLERALAIEHAEGFARPVLLGLYGSSEDVLAAAIGIYEEVRANGSADAATIVCLALLYAETTQPDEATLVLDDLGEEGAIAARILSAQPGSLAGARQEELLETLAATGLPQDFWDLADRRVAIVTGDGGRVATADARLVARGEQWTRRSFAILAANFGLMIFGLVLLMTRLPVVGELIARQGAAARWSLEDGIGVFVRGDFWNRLYFVSIPWLAEQPIGAAIADSWAGELLFGWGTIFASLPLLWLIDRHLLRPARLGAVEAFGLDPRARGLGRLGLVFACAVAVDLAGIHAISWGSFWLDVSTSWAEGFDEILAWGSTRQALINTSDYVVWTPAFEELAFRGVLYFSLRSRLGPFTAAVASAGFFAALHFYSLPGSLMTFWSGVVWALAFESTRSVLPGIAAHAVYNGLYVAGLVLLYR